MDVVCARAIWCRREILQATVDLALEIADEGQEGRHVGTLFILGDAEGVLARTRPLILDPLRGHAPAATHIADPQLRGTLKALAPLDGAFIIAEDGGVIAACRYVDVSAEGIELPFGLGSRHLTAAAVSRHLRVVAIAVSETGVVRIFCDGELFAEIGPHRSQRSFESAACRW
jgi:DNA integrity scanning protein DisA with diadenylate cyclase activity